MADSTTATQQQTRQKKLRIGQNVDSYDLKRMPTITRSKYYIYIDPTEKIQQAQNDSKKRLLQLKLNEKSRREQALLEQREANTIYTSSVMSLHQLKNPTLEESEIMLKNERDRHERLIGQLKAAEARTRTRIMKMRYMNIKDDEIEHLIDCQPTALKAVRLEAFLPAVHRAKPATTTTGSGSGGNGETLNPIQRRRLEALINDNSNSLIVRNN